MADDCTEDFLTPRGRAVGTGPADLLPARLYVWEGAEMWDANSCLLTTLIDAARRFVMVLAEWPSVATILWPNARSSSA